MFSEKAELVGSWCYKSGHISKT